MPRSKKTRRSGADPVAGIPPTFNLLLATLPGAVLARLQRHMKLVELRSGTIVHKPGQTIEDAYFPLDCLISVTVTMSGGHTAEAGIVGSREMVGVNAFMGGRETNQTEYICQSPGTAVRMAAAPLLKEFNKNKAVRSVMLRYTQAYVAQLSQNVACNRLHKVEQRLARWILECRDRLGVDEMNMTQHFMGQMLGVRRVSVTETASKLQRRGLIEYTRGKLRVLEAAELESASCECFRVIRREYDRLLRFR